MYIGLHVKYPSFSSDFKETWIFSTDFRKLLISSFMKIRQVGAELFHVDERTDEQTDITKLIVAFRNFTNAPQYIYIYIYATCVGVCMCGCFGNMWSCIYCVFVLFRLCIFILFMLLFNFVMFTYSYCYVCSVLYILFSSCQLALLG